MREISGFELRFNKTKHSSYELNRIDLIFKNPAHRLISVRSKALGIYKDCASFQWTNAVQAFALLLVSQALEQKKSIARVALTGEQGSLASSLDYALSKRPQWIVELFGSAQEIGSIFVRNNAGQKRVGPVAVGLSQRLIDKSLIRVLIANQEITQQDTLQDLANSFNDQATTVLRTTAESFEETNSLESYLSSMYYNEAVESLKLPIHTEQLWSEHLLKTKNLLAPFFKIPQTALKELMQAGAKTSRNRLGLSADLDLLRQKLKQYGGLRIAISPAMAGNLILFNYLRYACELPLELDLRFSNALEIKDLALRGNLPQGINAMTLATAPALSYLREANKTYFKAVQILPAVGHAILQRHSDLDQLDRIALIADDISTPLLHLCSFSSQERLSLKKKNLVHVTPESALQTLSETNEITHAAFYFPIYRLANANGRYFITKAASQSSWIPVTLFLANDLARDRELLDLLSSTICDAWIKLRQDTHACRLATAQLNSDKDFMPVVSRIAGIDC